MVIVEAEGSVMRLYRVYLVNFGMVVYEGDNLVSAKTEAVKSGFETVVYHPDGKVDAYSPIGGWR